MSVVILSTGYYPDPDIGKPIANGYIYVGKVDLDPEIVANQKTISVLQEDGAEVAVSQPLRTSAGGVPTYNGSPVTIIAASPYSLLVKDSDDVQKIYSPSNTGSSQANEDWSEEGGAVLFVDATNFTVAGDVTTTYTIHRAVKLTQTSADTGFVTNSSYSAQTGLTTVTVRAATVDSGLTAVEYGQEVASSPGGSPDDFHANIVGTHTGPVVGDVTGGIVEESASNEVWNFKKFTFTGWNMDTTDSITVNTGITNSKIRNVYGVVTNTAGTGQRPLTHPFLNLGIVTAGQTAIDFTGGPTGTQLTVERLTGGVFDDAAWNDSDGFLTVTYSE